MGLPQLKIVFDNPVNFPGKTVTGRVVIVLDTAKNIQELIMKFRGKASVHWRGPERQAYGWSGRVTRNYDDNENFFSYKYVVDSDKNGITLRAGENVYVFQFILPLGIPSSYEGEYGNVTYEVEAVLKRSWNTEHNLKQQFLVDAIVDLNLDPFARRPVQLNKDKTLCWLCCASGPIGILIKLPKRGYVAKEFIVATAELTNLSNRHIKTAYISLVQTAKFYACGEKKETSKILKTVKRTGIKPGNSDIWQGNLIEVPFVPASKLGNCRLIDVQYHLNFELVVSGPSRNLKATIPIVIGTIPITATTFEEKGITMF